MREFALGSYDNPAFQCVARLAFPALGFKSEAIVHPDQIVPYTTCANALSYNPLIHGLALEAAATKKFGFLILDQKRHNLPEGCAWVNIPLHDDIAGQARIRCRSARLKASITAVHDRSISANFGSFARGLSFQYNPVTHDMRICGTAASLAGSNGTCSATLARKRAALRRFLLLYGIAFSAGAFRFIYLGDDLARKRSVLDKDPAHTESRRVHRPVWRKCISGRHNPATLTVVIAAKVEIGSAPAFVLRCKAKRCSKAASFGPAIPQKIEKQTLV